ncbi:hypothetical protein CBR_g1016 [Chara braunii]|uniref:Maleylacetoacetate isomerase n=1 Tax=Chara braunii TaxID=69332 RepID=A0A388KD10_CHABU|nr:hypothetical protein CBR_g1016 [Chara braunii]|eukprot:GBG67897.1 hypothetical protein CBR_g1016 [Chara braunii]
MDGEWCNQALSFGDERARSEETHPAMREARRRRCEGGGGGGGGGGAAAAISSKKENDWEVTMASAAATPAAAAAAEAASAAAATGTLIKLHGFPASPTSMLARITLNLKGVPYEFIPLAAASMTNGAPATAGTTTTTLSVGGIGESVGVGEGGEGGGNGLHVDDGGGSMPWLEDGGHRVTQTGAIFNYINEMYPRPPLLPKNATARAAVRSIATYVACEIQPFGFYRVVRYLMDEGGKSPDWVREWRRHWLREGFGKVESKLADISVRPGRYCYEDMPTMADVFLIPQVHISQGPDVEIDLKDFPYIKKIYENCLTNSAFKDAFPVD